MKIRSCDIYGICNLGIAMHQRGRFSKYPLNLERAAFILEKIKDDDNVFAQFQVNQDDNICAVLVGEVATDHSVDVDIASTIMLYADGTPTGVKQLLRLISKFEEWAEGRAHLVSIDVSGGIEDNRFANLLAGRGYGDGGRRVVKETAYGS